LESGDKSADLTAPARGFLVREGDDIVVRSEDTVEREYVIPHNAKLMVENGVEIRAGDAITDGPINPQEYLETRGKDSVQRYLVKEVQKVYRSQGVTITTSTSRSSFARCCARCASTSRATPNSCRPS